MSHSGDAVFFFNAAAQSYMVVARMSFSTCIIQIHTVSDFPLWILCIFLSSDTYSAFRATVRVCMRLPCSQNQSDLTGFPLRNTIQPQSPPHHPPQDSASPNWCSTAPALKYNTLGRRRAQTKTRYPLLLGAYCT